MKHIVKHIMRSRSARKRERAFFLPKRQAGALLLLALVALSVQGCLGIGGSGKQIATSSNGQQTSVNQVTFKGKIYLTINQNLYVLNGDTTTKELVNSGNVYDPAVSPDGSKIAFIQKFKDYSNLAYVSAGGGPIHVLLSGNGHYYPDPIDHSIMHNNFYWYMQPTWSPDGSHLLFLSDLQKNYIWANLGSPFNDAPFEDLQVFSIPVNNPSATPQVVAYASFGDGGDRDVSFRPGHPDQIIYTHYSYDAKTETQQNIQLYMENPNTIGQNPGKYYPGGPGAGFDPSIAVTGLDHENIEPAFSPDGSAIAFIQRNQALTDMNLCVMPTPPDAITQNPNDPKTETQALQSYQSHVSHLLTETYIEQPVWSPDGKQIAYIQYTGGSFDLWIANISYDAKTSQYSITGSPVQVTSGGVDGASRPVWTK
jgi:dipeptidyl aminopeptidase/acylaminoacyl peptidase